MEEEANQLYGRPQMAGQTRDEEERRNYPSTILRVAFLIEPVGENSDYKPPDATYSDRMLGPQTAK